VGKIVCRTIDAWARRALAGDRRGQHSIRINDQWRICFVWKDGDAHQVEIVDDH
jgi:proteic killer suppression protein